MLRDFGPATPPVSLDGLENKVCGGGPTPTTNSTIAPTKVGIKRPMALRAGSLAHKVQVDNG